ncbi:MAG: DUF116 domain-containing protein [Intestinibacter bartlettii]|uniref:DUF116 domain-containing protein n=1 Tax=Intestinibacter bartlettii TaxID=261299 RepID=UPI0026EBF33E|nr:DUF116 domain-containing protein [Intestinibacter bartlettii]MDO5010468.1 DUF116 domain-containing protein [Intestinibacter bartlettii]
MITYNLNIDGKTYDDYYSTLKQLGKMIIDKDYNKSKKYIDDFKVYIQNFEKLRDDKYYFIEIMLIGVLFDEYIDYTPNYKPYLSFFYDFLNKKRNSKFKSQIDIIRGKINTSLYSIKNDKSNYKTKFTNYSLDDFYRLIKWLDATYDFKDEVVRLKIWYEFLKTKSKDYVSFFFDFTLNHVEYIKKLGDENLLIYLPNLENYLNTYKQDHYNKEDIIYCGKGFIQYYFNMIFSEVMNDIFRDDFLNTDKKVVFLPACMTQDKTPCKCSNTSYGGRCNFCSSNCNVNRISKLGQKYNFKVYIIEHETTLSSLDINKNIGIVGIACASNLIAGGFKALKLGFIPQCVVLDYCGCSNHWLDKKLMTSINENRLLKIILNN